MIKINKREKDYLVSKGFVWHDTITRTYSKHPTYYAVETPALLRALEKYRKEIVR